jgi:hypothetical protein
LVSSVPIASGIYTITVGGNCKVEGYGSHGYEIVGYSGDNQTIISRCRPYSVRLGSDTSDNVQTAWVKIGSTGKFTVRMQFDSLAHENGSTDNGAQNHNMITYIMLTRIGNL